MKNFFAFFRNDTRVKPVHISGNTMFGEFRVKNHGNSTELVRIRGVQNDDGTITSRITVFDPTGKVVFDRPFTVNK